MKRIFFALNFSEETKKEIKEKYGKKLESEELKPVKKENIHITLLFLGHFNEEKINELREKAGKIKQKKFTVLIKGTGNFSSKIIFLEIKKGEKEINELHEKLCTELEMPDEKFNAHATIARNKKMNAKKFLELAEELKKIHFEKETEIKSLDLMESALSDSGTEYKKIFSFELL